MPLPGTTGAAEGSNGQRLARLRLRRRWAQQRLADESGYSLSAVRAFEQGLRSLDRPAVILALSGALDCHPTEITGQPYAPSGSDPEGQTAVAAVAAVRRALMRHGRPTRPTELEVDAVDLIDLSRRVAEANGHRHNAALSRTAETLPALLRDLQVAAEVIEGEARRRAFDLLTNGYECAMQFLYKLGRTSDATFATERVQWAAEQTEDPLRILAARWWDAGEFLSIGEHAEAGAVIDDALTQLGAHARTPQSLSLEGAFHLKAALNAALSNDSAGAERHWKKAEAAADALAEDRNDYQLQFGPTNVAIWSVSLPVEMGRGKDAVRRAAKIKLPQTYAPERASHHLIDVGRAYFYHGQRDQAIGAFLEAERLAPQQTRMHAGVRETVRIMMRTQRRSQLVEFGIRLGVV